MSDLFEGGVIERLKEKIMLKAKKKGCSCPVCGQFVKVYKRQITSTMANLLLKAYKMHGIHKEFHVKTLENSSGEFAKLRYWGLIINHQEQNSSRCNSGLWNLTAAAEAFINGDIHLSKYILVYDGKALSAEPGTSSFEDCLGEPFNYQKLMSN